MGKERIRPLDDTVGSVTGMACGPACFQCFFTRTSGGGTEGAVDKPHSRGKWPLKWMNAVGHKKHASLFWTITPAFLDEFQHFVHQ